MSHLQPTLFDSARTSLQDSIDTTAWPRGWDGSEPLASIPFANVNPDGSVQPIMEGLLR